MKDYDIEKLPKGPQKPIVEDVGTHYRLDGDNFWYERILGGRDIPLITLGPGANPDPRHYKDRLKSRSR